MGLTDTTTPNADNPTDPMVISALAAEIAEATSALGELTPLERPVGDALREQVARILNRYEQYPGQIRDTEERLMEIRDPLLPIALLQQYFLVRSEPVERSIVAQLARLAQVADPKAGQLALAALRGAAYSEIDRLRNLGAKALFASQKLNESEIYGYAVDPNAPFLLRLEALTALISSRCKNGPKAFLAILTDWCKLSESDRTRYNERLQELARSFRNYQSEDEKAAEVVRDLFSALEDNRFARLSREIANSVRRNVQEALASLREATLFYAEMMSPQSLTYDHIFTLKRIARKSPDATRVLIGWLATLATERDVPGRPESLAREIARSLKQAQWGDNVDVSIAALRTLLEDSWLENAEEIIAQLESIETSLSEPPNLAQMLAEYAADYEALGELERDQVLNLRYVFERQHRQLSPQSLTPAMKKVLISALRDTSNQHPWRASIRWFTQNYQHFQGQERMAILEAVGQVARVVQQPDIETRDFRVLREFLVNVEQTGTPSEAGVARKWLSQLSTPTRPQTVRVVEGDPITQT